MHAAGQKKRLGTALGAMMLLIAALFVLWPGTALGGQRATAARAATPMHIARTILGHRPTGLARTIALRGTVRVANDANYRPESYIDPVTHQIVGFDVDVARRVAHILGLKVVWKHPLWKYVIRDLRAGRFDVSIGSMNVTAERKLLVAFTSPYYFQEGQAIVKTGGTQITGPADLAGKKVAVKEWTSQWQYLNDSTTAIVRSFETDDQALTDLLAGTADFWVAEPYTGREAILAPQPVEFSGKPLFYLNLAFALHKGERDWRTLLNYTVKKLHNNGALTTLSTKWHDGLDLSVKQ